VGRILAAGRFRRRIVRSGPARRRAARC